MSFRKIFICLVGICLLVGGATTPGFSVVDSTSYWGSAARGMGGAYTAVGGDLGGISYNPANSATLRNGQFVSDFNKLAQRNVEVNNTALGTGFRTGDFVHGFALYRTDLSFDFGNFELKSADLGLEYTDDIYYYNLAWNLSPTGHLATNLKYFSVSSDVKMNDGAANASGYGFDLGYLQYISSNLTLGCSIKNLMASRDWGTGTSEDIPLEARLGTRYRPAPDIALEADLVYGENPGLRSLNFGGEWWLWSEYEAPAPSYRKAYFRFMQGQPSERIKYGISLRAGVEKEMAGGENTNLSLGLGMQFGAGQLDYSFQQQSNFDNRHYFGFSSSFGELTGEDEEVEDYASTSRTSEPNIDTDLADEKTSSGPIASAKISDKGSLNTAQQPGAQKLKIGLLQWNIVPAIKFPAELIQAEFALHTEHDLTVYERRQQLQKAIISGNLGEPRIKSLLKSTGQDILITGRLKQNGGKFKAVAYILRKDNQKIITAQRPDKRELAQKIVEKINRYLSSQQKAKRPGKSRKKLHLPVSVKVGLLEWITDSKTKFKPEKLQQSLVEVAGLNSSIYAADYSLKRALVENALTPQQYKQLLQQANKDMLITGEIKRKTGGYVATAYIIRPDQNFKLKVDAPSKDKILKTLSRTLQSRLSS